jgi:ABC-type transporter Mla subunit MlaD
MPLQDLTPELRKRLHRVERNIGWFVVVAAIILLAGFGYYLYAAAAARGWFVTKLNYATSLDSAAGLAVGDAITLMGFNVGEITRIKPNDPVKEHGVTIYFNIREPNWDYIWYDSRVRVNSDFLGHRFLEVTKGQNNMPRSAETNHDGTLMVMNSILVYKTLTNVESEIMSRAENKDLPKEAILAQATNQILEILRSKHSDYYTNANRARFTRPLDLTAKNFYYIPALEEPALSDRLAEVATRIQVALPGILSMTNQLAAVLSNANFAVSQLNGTLAETRPTLTNLAVITGNLRDPNGSLGNWLLPTNLTAQLNQTLQSARDTLGAARETLDTTDTNLTKVATDLDATLQHLSDLTSNLAWQVSVNTNLVSEISTTIVHTDDLIQGLKREWFLRGAFKKKKPSRSDETKTIGK